MGWERQIPGYEERSVVVRRMAVVLDVVALLPDTEVVQSGGSVEAHSGTFLFWVKQQWGYDQQTGLTYSDLF